MTQYGFGCDMGFQEPVNQTGSLELPKYDPNKNYFECYWGLFLKNEQILE